MTMLGLSGVAGVFLVGLVFGFFPVFTTNLLVRLYPPGHPRRRELLAELAVVPTKERIVWVFGIAATALFEAIPARWRTRQRPWRLFRREKVLIGPIQLVFPMEASGPEDAQRIAAHHRAAGRHVTLEGNTVTVHFRPEDNPSDIDPSARILVRRSDIPPRGNRR